MYQEREVELDEVVGNILTTYDDKCYSAVLACIKRSMSVLRRRLCSSSGGGVLYVNQVRCQTYSFISIMPAHKLCQPFFQVDVELCVPSVTMNPSLDDIQAAINQCAMQIIRSTQQIAAWKMMNSFDRDDKQKHVPTSSNDNQRRNMQSSIGKTIHARVTNDIEMVKNVLILTGAVQTLRDKVHKLCDISFFTIH